VNRSREQMRVQVLADLSDTLVADFDLVEFLHLLCGRCVEILDVQAAGIMVAGPGGWLRMVASSSEQALLLELFEVASEQGPCVDCYQRGEPVADANLDTPNPRWHAIAGRARQAGFRAVHAVPVRLRDEVIGVLIMFAASPGEWDAGDMRVARALANVTTLGLLQHRAVEYRQVLAEQLQSAMNSRVVIEQAKGVLAEQLNLEMGPAFNELRRYAALTGHLLSDTAAAVTAGDYGPVLPGDSGRLRVLLIHRFARQATMAGLRAAVSAVTARHGLSEPQAQQFVLAVNEAVTNAVEHGAGAGQLLLWLHGGTLYAEISDQGPGMPAGPHLPTEAPGADPYDSRGLWLISQVCATVEVDSSAAGTRILLVYPLNTVPLDPDTGLNGA
jgi:anti-sigma regulatory factor (Ser/Thr protein kinase)